MSDDALRRALASLALGGGSGREGETTRLAGDDQQTFRETIERATTAMDDVEQAAAFVEDDGLDELERALEQAEQSVSACAADGRRALAAYREFRDAAEGGRPDAASVGLQSDGEEAVGDHFHPGHGTSLGGGDIGQSK